MRGRARTVASVVAVLAAACGQAAPERSPLPEIPEDLANQVVTVPITNDGSCVLTVGEGALVLDVDDSLGGGSLFAPGDIITALAGSPVTSDQTLIAELRDHEPGDVVSVDYLRDGEPLSGDTTLSPNPEDPTAAVLGLRVDTSLAGYAPVGAPQGELVPERTHLLAVEGSLYLHDPVAIAWQSLGVERPIGSVVALSDGLYTVDPTGFGLVELGTTTVIPLETSGRLILNLLGTIDGLLVASLVEVSEGGVALDSAAVAGIDVASNQVVWEWDTGQVEGEVVRPVLGVANPDDRVTAITSLVGEQRLHSLLDAEGNVVAGWGTEFAFLPESTLVAGWYGDSVLAFVDGSETEVTLNAVNVIDFTYSRLAVLDSTETLRQVWAVGDGQSVVVIGGTESKVFDIPAGTPGRLMTRACDAFEIAGPTALQAGL